MTFFYRQTFTASLSALLLSFSTILHAGNPVWTFTPLTSTSQIVPANSTATVQYLVTNQSAKSHHLVMTPITGISQTSTGVGICSNPFTLPSRGSSCTLSLQINGSELTHPITEGPIVCEQNSTLQCYQPSAANRLNIDVGANATTLSASVLTLGLSVNNTGLNTALIGTPRNITITNTGSVAATTVTYSPSPALPTGTTISPASCGTIAAADTCVLRITPGSTASATAGDTSPTPITLSISGTNTNTLTPTVNILTYGSVYQGGYLYAVDDTTPDTGSIGGSVVTQTDQAPRGLGGIVWSSNGAGSAAGDASYDSIPKIDETSTTGSPQPTYANSLNFFNATYSNESTYPFPSDGSFPPCNGRVAGACNSANILTLYNTYITQYGIGGYPYTLLPGPTTSSYYAAGRCTASISGYSDWYLPAICEMGPNSNSSGCSVTTQNIVNQLPGLIGDPNAGDPSTSCSYGANCLAGDYWSSTEDSGFADGLAWSQYFASGGASTQDGYGKGEAFGVRCSRALTP